MILDAGICTVFHPTDTALPGDMPQRSYVPIWASWYARLNWETSPAYPSAGRQEQRVALRIRITQHPGITQNDVVVLEHLSTFAEAAGKTAYRVVRAFHGKDDDSPAEISDLTLEVFKP